jgi:calcineurin-like phosphoesterase family protein
MSKLVTADPHFGHKNIIKYSKRPFSNVKEMDEAMIANWNGVVNHNDEVHVIGDFAHCCSMEYALSVIKRLKGIKHLVLGNHDDELGAEMNNVRPGTWKTVKERSVIYIQNQKIILDHYAGRTWWHSYQGSAQLFGHTHGDLPPFGKSFDCGVDCWNYTPLTEAQIMTKLDSLPNAHTISEHKQWDKSNTVITT